MKKVKQVEVKKLFGYKTNNYTIDLLENEPLTFIYAFNGVGKTSLLRLIDAAIKRKMIEPETNQRTFPARSM